MILLWSLSDCEPESFHDEWVPLAENRSCSLLNIPNAQPDHDDDDDDVGAQGNDDDDFNAEHTHK